MQSFPFVLAHHYQDEAVLERAGFIGDTLELVRAAGESTASVLAVCGSRFMAELVKIAYPDRKVLLPDLSAGCSLVDSCPADAVRLFRQRNPRHAIVAHLNTSAAVKAEADILCSSRNAVAIVNSIPAGQPILFVPDVNLGTWVKLQTNRQNMQIWQGACIVHSTFQARKLVNARNDYPQALVAAHPSCSSAVLRLADFIGSTSSIVEWCCQQPASEFILCVDSGVRHTLKKQTPAKRFHFVQNENCNCSECPYTRVNTLEKLLDCLKTLAPSIELSEDLISRARVAYQRMLEIA